MSDGLKVLAYDLETSPNLGYVWSLWKQNIALSQLKEQGEIICFGAQWLGSDQVIIDNVYRSSKVEMVEHLHSLIDEADALLGWNSKGFDFRWANYEFVQAGLLPPSPVHHIDLMLAVRRKFRAPSNKLEHWAQILLGEGKVQHSGFDLWKRCMAGDPEAWEEMERYQEQDVRLLPELYEILLPWIDGHPNVTLYDGDEKIRCMRCTSEDLRREGYRTTQAGKYQRFQCRSCGAWGQLPRAIEISTTREAR